MAGATWLSIIQRRSAVASPGTPSGVGGASLMPKPGRSGAKTSRSGPSALSRGTIARLDMPIGWTSTIGAVPGPASSGSWPFSARWELERHQRSPGRIGPPLPLARRFSSAGTRTQTRWPPDRVQPL